jgi:hypothetical protein
VQWDLQTLGGGFSNAGGGTGGSNLANDPNLGSFGFVLIAGPSDVVSLFSKRDASDIEFVDCFSLIHSERQVTRIFCSSDADDSNCDDVLQGGVDGTVVRMPDACGLGTYIVVHSLKDSDDQSLPNHLYKRKATTKTIMDLEFSYDFGLMKRADEDVYLRIDYSNMPGLGLPSWTPRVRRRSALAVSTPGTCRRKISKSDFTRSTALPGEKGWMTLMGQNSGLILTLMRMSTSSTRKSKDARFLSDHDD